MKKLFGYLKKLQIYFRRENIENPWEFNGFFAAVRPILKLTGLITYESSFTDIEISSLKEILIFAPVAAFAFVNFLFAVITVVKESSADIYAGIMVLPLVIAGGTLVAQGIRMYFWKRNFQNFVRQLRHLWNAESSNSIDDELLATSKEIHLVVKLFLCLAVTAAALFLLRPFYGLITYILNGDYEKFLATKVLPSLYPFVVNNMARYVLCNLLEAYAVVYVSICRCAIGMSFVIQSGIISLQLQIVGTKFRNIVKDSKTTETESDLLKLLHEVARQHSNLLSCCRKFDELYTPVIFATVMQTGLSLAISVIIIQKDSSEGKVLAAVSFSYYFVCVLAEMAMYCHSTEMISHWASQISYAIYDCQWLNQSETFKKSMFIIMIAAQRGYNFKVYGLYEINRVLLTRVVILAINSITVLSNVNSLKSY